VPDLASALSKATSLRAAIAYWTVEPDFVDDNLANVLSNRGSFLCVDLHFPTDIDQLALLKKQEANVHIHIGDLCISTETVERQMPHHLLHTKLLLFDFEDGLAEIWCGSHNWTKRGLTGPNIEASIVLEIRQDSSVYDQVSTTLEEIKENCRPFDLTEIDYYRHLRGEDAQRVSVIELEASGAHELEGKELTLFGKDPKDLDRLGKIGSEVYLSVLDLQEPRWVVYRSTIVGNSELPGTISRFEPRRFVRQKGVDFALLEAPSTPPLEELSKTHHYYLTVNVRELIQPQMEMLDPSFSYWECSSDDPLIRRMDSGDFSWMIRNKKSKIIRRPLPETSLVAERAPIDEDLTDLVKRRIIRLSIEDDPGHDLEEKDPEEGTMLQPRLFD
jgi:hypothetical protein